MRKSSRIGLLALGCAALMMVGSAGRAEQQPPADPVVSPMQQTAFERLRTATQLMQMGAAGQMKEVAIADTEYKIIRQAYVNDQIIINYPQVTGLSDRRKQEKINALISKEAMYWLDQYTEEQLGRLTLEVICEIKAQTPDLLSIFYFGLSYLQGAAHPLHVFYTTNNEEIGYWQPADDAFGEKLARAASW